METDLPVHWFDPGDEESPEVDAGRLVALKPGYLPGELEAPRDADGAPLWPQEVTLRLGGAPLELVGAVSALECVDERNQGQLAVRRKQSIDGGNDPGGV